MWFNDASSIWRLSLNLFVKNGHRPSKDFILASEIMDIYPLQRKKLFFSRFCVHMASKKSTFQRHILIKCENCRDRLCDRFREYFKYYWPTPQNSLEEWILAGEIVDIYPSRRKTVVLSSLLASKKNTIFSIFDTKRLTFRIYQISAIRLIPWESLLDQRETPKVLYFGCRDCGHLP